MKHVAAAVMLALVLASCSSNGSKQATNTTAAAPAAKYVPGPCPKTPVPVQALANARCGVLTVPENRTKDNGRTIALAVATVPSKSPTPAPDPVVHLAGGPGSDGILFADTVIGADANKDRDVIFMSPRGGATSNPSFVCPELDKFDESVLGLVYDAPSTGQAQVEAAKQCRDRIVSENRGVDLSAYDTTEAANDLADLKKALNIKEWNVFGHSYGTDLAQTFVRLHPEGVRTLLLDGVVPPAVAGPVAWVWQTAAEGFNAMFQACAQQAPCAARYPNLGQKFNDLVNQLEASPVRTTVTTDDGRTFQVVIDGGVLANWMILGMHHPQDVPSWLDQLAHGQPQNIAKQWVGRKAIFEDAAGTFSQGFGYSVMCSEWTPYVAPDTDLPGAKKAFPSFPDSVLAQGPQLPFLRDTCKTWNVTKAPSSIRDELHTNIRTLVMSGTFDAQTGAQWGDLVASKLSNVVNLKFPGVAHGPFVKPCGSQIMTSFWDTPNSPDTSCLPSVQPPPFVIG